MNNFTPPKEVTSLDISPRGLAPWSHSKLKCLDKCPQQFYLKHVLKIKPLVPVVVSLTTEVGKAAHKVLEYVCQGKSLQDSFMLTKREYAAVIQESDWGTHVTSLEFGVQRFAERMDSFQKQNPFKRVLPELRVAVDYNWQPTGFFAEDCYFRGVIDYTVMLENGDAIFLDHKTGAPAELGIKNFKAQLDTYKALFNFGIERIEGAQAGVHFIRDGEIKLDLYSDNAEIENVLKNRVEFSIDSTVEKVKEIGFFKHVRGAHCKYCEFDPDCKNGAFKQVSLDSKKWFPITPVD